MPTITIKKNAKYSLKMPTFLVDHILNNKMEAEPYKSMINKSGCFTAFVGKAGQGKTSLMLSLFNDKLLLKKQFNHIYVVMPKTSRHSIKKNIFDKYLPPENIYDDLNDNVLEVIMSHLEENSLDNNLSCVVLDDVARDLKQCEHNLLKLILNRRHYKTHIFITLQTIKLLSLSLRKNLTSLFLFRPSKLEYEDIIKEFLNLSREHALALIKLYKDPHDYMAINNDTKRIFINQDEIIISDD